MPLPPNRLKNLERNGVAVTPSGPVLGAKKGKTTPAEPSANGAVAEAVTKAGRPLPVGGEWWTTAPNLTRTICDDLNRVGLVGEEDAGLLLYAAYTSRLLDRPLSAIVRGPSGSGKDALQRLPAELMPPDAVVEATSLTGQALYYAGSLQHKIVLGGEWKHEDTDAARDYTAAIRQMLSNGFIVKRSVRDGEAVELRADGPIVFTATTTRDKLFPEDANRCLLVHTDPSAEQTRRILVSKAAGYAEGRSSADRETVRERHHRFQNSLVKKDVCVPFAGVLAENMPADRIDVRRRFDQVLTLIEAVAFLHQHRRPSDRQGRLIATLDDYALARRLVLGPLQAAVGLGADHARWAAVLGRMPASFTSTQAHELLDANSRKVLHVRLGRMAELGLIVQAAPAAGNQPALWRKTGKAADEVLLPSVEMVAAVLGGPPGG